MNSESEKWKLLSPVWLCDPTDYPVHEILQARVLDQVAIPFSRGSSQPRDWTQEDSLPAVLPGTPLGCTFFFSNFFHSMINMEMIFGWETKAAEEAVQTLPTYLCEDWGSLPVSTL